MEAKANMSLILRFSHELRRTSIKEKTSVKKNIPFFRFPFPLFCFNFAHSAFSFSFPFPLFLFSFSFFPSPSLSYLSPFFLFPFPFPLSISFTPFSSLSPIHFPFLLFSLSFSSSLSTGWGDQSWIKPFLFPSMYRPSCLIESSGGPEKYWLVCAGMLLIHLFNLSFIFLIGGLTTAAV